MGSKPLIYPNNYVLHLAAFISVLLLLGGVLSGHAFAQTGSADESAAGAGAAAGSYSEDPLDKDQENKKNAIGAILIAGKFADAGEESKFDAYYKTFALPRWTQLSNLNSLYKFRTKDLYSNLRNAKGQVHDHLNDLVLEYMEKVAKSDRYHPTVRYNAVLAIGDLNSVEGIQPTPLGKALPVLLALVNDANLIVPVKIGALVGINRHVAAGVSDPQTQNQILIAMLKLVPAPAATDEGHEWLRKQAVEILGLLGNLGTNNQAVTILSGIVGDQKALFDIRFDAAEALGKLKYANANGLKPSVLINALGQLMFDACNEELGGENGAKLDAYDHLRRIKARLVIVIDALKGIKTLAKEQPQQTYLNELQGILDNCFKELDKLDTKTRDSVNKDDLQKSITDCQTKLQTWLAKKLP
jgi:hypothetical protein